MQTDLAAAFAKLREPRQTAVDVTPAHIVRRVFDVQNARRRAARKALVNPENAAELVGQIATLREGDRLHAITPGNFIFCDLITQLAERMKPEAVSIATLSLSTGNVDSLAAALDGGHIGALDFLISDYFSNVNKAIRQHMDAAAKGRKWRIGTARTHAKVALLSPNVVLETSANLRSSQNIEQVTAIADRELHDFHRSWIASLMP